MKGANCTKNLFSLLLLILQIADTAVMASYWDDFDDKMADKPVVKTSEFYEFHAPDIATGESVSFEKYKGKVVLVVNVASQSNYTDRNYRELVELQDKFNKSDFQVLAFPNNQFHTMEPGENIDIWRFAREKYNVNFDMFEKVEVYDSYYEPNCHPVYRWLAKEAHDQIPTWSFSKYLLSREGKVKRYGMSWVNPRRFEEDIKMLIDGKKIRGGVLWPAYLVPGEGDVDKEELWHLRDEL